MNDLDISREEFVARLAEIRHVVRKLKKSQEEVEKTKELLAQSAE